MPVGQILPDVVDVVYGLAKFRDLLFNILRLAAVQHRGGQKQRQFFGRSLGHILPVAVTDQIQLGKDGQVVVQQLADDRRVGQRRGADQRGVGVLGGDGLADGGIGCVRQTQPEGLVAAALGGVHADDLNSRVNAFGQPGAAFAHAA